MNSTVLFCAVLCCTGHSGTGELRLRGTGAQGAQGAGAQGHTSTGSEAQEHRSKGALRPYHITLYVTLLEHDAILLYRNILYVTVLFYAVLYCT